MWDWLTKKETLSESLTHGGWLVIAVILFFVFWPHGLLPAALVLAVWITWLCLRFTWKALHWLFGKASQNRLATQERHRQSLAEEDRERAEEKRRKAAAREASAQERRENARAACEILYATHAPELATRFPREQFDQYVARLLGDQLPPATVEERARELQHIIRKHLAKVDPPKKKMTLAELAQWFLREKEQIDATALSEEDKQVLIGQLEERYAKLQEKYLRGVEP